MHCTQPDRVLKLCEDVLQLQDLEGEPSVRIYAVFCDTFQVCVAYNDFARDTATAGPANSAKSVCEGNDADGNEEI